jgi:transposase InsO family protein
MRLDTRGNRGIVVNTKKIRRLMREHTLNPKQHRRFIATTDSDKGGFSISYRRSPFLTSAPSVNNRFSRNAVTRAMSPLGLLYGPALQSQPKYCVSGTCSKFGGRRAANIKNCQPENCRDFVATNVKATAAMRKESAATRKPLCSLTSWSWLWIWPHQDCVAANGINRALRQGEK